MKKFIELLQQNVLIAPLIALVLLLLGFGLGFAVGFMTTEFKPNTDDVVMAADSYAINPNGDLAKARLKGLNPSEQTTIINRLIADRLQKGQTREVERLTTLAQVLGVNVGTSPAPSGGTSSASASRTSSAASAPTTATGGDQLMLILGILLVVVLAAAAGLIFYTRFLPRLRQPRAPSSATTATPSATPAATTTESRFGVSPAPTTTPGGLGRFVPTYNLGNDNYDTSYSLETAKGEFLGECGMGISETIGEGKPDKVTAFDLWLFDKADVRTVTQIVMSDFAFKDQTLRTKLATKGEAVLAEKGKTLRLDTQSLSIEAHIVEMVYASNPSFPPNSHFQKLVIEIVPLLKEGAAAR